MFWGVFIAMVVCLTPSHISQWPTTQFSAMCTWSFTSYSSAMCLLVVFQLLYYLLCSLNIWQHVDCNGSMFTVWTHFSVADEAVLGHVHLPICQLQLGHVSIGSTFIYCITYNINYMWNVCHNQWMGKCLLHYSCHHHVREMVLHCRECQVVPHASGNVLRNVTWWAHCNGTFRGGFTPPPL